MLYYNIGLEAGKKALKELSFKSDPSNPICSCQRSLDKCFNKQTENFTPDQLSICFEASLSTCLSYNKHYCMCKYNINFNTSELCKSNKFHYPLLIDKKNHEPNCRCKNVNCNFIEKIDKQLENDFETDFMMKEYNLSTEEIKFLNQIEEDNQNEPDDHHLISILENISFNKSVSYYGNIMIEKV